jgi:hypothetical protein
MGKEKINKARILRWVQALESGKYKQGQGQLCSLGRKGKPAFCCLGVLADIEVEGSWVPHTFFGSITRWRLETDKELGGERELAGELAECALPSALWDELGIPEDQGNLINKNDAGFSFKQIAKYLRDTYLGNEKASNEQS